MEVYRILAIFVAFLGVFAEESGNDEVWPKGHLQPLGSHRPHDEVEERHDFPSPQDFWENYVKISKPVVFRGAALQSAASKLWTEEFLRITYGNLEVRLEGKKEKQSEIPVGAKGIGRDTIENFINQMHTRNAYTVSELPVPMWNDVTVIPPLTCGIFAKRLVEVDLWLSGGGTSSILHKDAFNAINCLLNGTKEWKLIEFKYQHSLYKVWEPDREIGGFSALNVEAVDLLRYPKVKDVPWAFTTLHAGDCLFLPKSMWHQVKSYGSLNAAVALLFSRFDEQYDMDFSDCGMDLSPVPLSKFELDWQYPGYGEMSMGNPDLYSIRHMLREVYLEGDSQVLTVDKLVPWIEGMYDEKDEMWIQQKALKIIEAVESVSGGPVSLDDLENCNRSCLRAFALSVEPTTVENTENFEYNYVHPEYIRDIVLQLTQEYGKLEKNIFVEQYQKVVRGTEAFGLKLFIALGGEDKDTIPPEEVRMNLENALQPYIHYQSEDLEPPEDVENFPSPYDARLPIEHDTHDHKALKDEL